MIKGMRKPLLLAIALALTGEAVASDAAEDRKGPGANSSRERMAGARLNIEGDPLYVYQWHLKNTGQKGFGDLLPVPGVDLNIGDLHDSGVRGAGVIVGIVDDGLEVHHEDLAANVVFGGSKNFVDGSNDPTPTDARNAHGTNVAGVVAEVGWNGIGGRGVAPEAHLKGFNFLDSSFVKSDVVLDSDENIRYAWGGGPEAADVDVFVNSWSFAETFYSTKSREEQKSWERLMAATRHGLGGIYVKAAGNDYGEDAICPRAAELGLGCISPNLDPFDNFIHTITVAALDPDGRRSYYSLMGSSIWITGLGGGDGHEVAVGGSSPETEKDSWPGIVSTDLSGCDRGNANVRNSLDGGSSPLNPDCRYESAFSGTSAATPTVSGVVALMLGVSPHLTQRDVKYILATTARWVDHDQPKVVYKDMVLDPGWITNAAGHRFSNWYGFGLVDASAAVDKARTFASLPAMQDTDWLSSDNSPVPIGLPNPRHVMHVDVQQDMKVETLQFAFGTTHKNPENLSAILTSPEGTKSYVLTPFANLKSRDGEGFDVSFSSSNAFLDESSHGLWTLEVVDVTGEPSDATLESFNLRIVGY